MQRVMERRFLRVRCSSLRTRLGEELTLNELIGTSAAMERVKDVIGKVRHRLPVLIEGESGTGKELVAAAIHRLSSRGQGPFIPVNCSAIPPDLLESGSSATCAARSGRSRRHARPVPGRQRGDDLPDDRRAAADAAGQAPARAAGDAGAAGGIDAGVSGRRRVIAATNRNLEQPLTEGDFRQDLFYRLNVIRITLPPLRDRRRRHSGAREPLPAPLQPPLPARRRGITPEALEALAAYEFPGNVRELENLLERAFAMGARVRQITLADLPSLHRAHSPACWPAPSRCPLPTGPTSRSDLILKALAMNNNDKGRGGAHLGISCRTIYRRLKGVREALARRSGWRRSAL